MADEPIKLAEGKFEPTVCILAGGKGTRINHTTKCLIELHGTTLLERTVASLRAQFSSVGIAAPAIVLSINDPSTKLTRLAKELDITLLADADHIRNNGPLAGIATCLKYVADNSQISQGVLTIAADTYTLPPTLVKAFTNEVSLGKRQDLIYASTKKSPAYTCAYWPLTYKNAVFDALKNKQFSLKSFYKNNQASVIFFDSVTAKNMHGQTELLDPFFNINTPSDMAFAEHLAAPAPTF